METEKNLLSKKEVFTIKIKTQLLVYLNQGKLSDISHVS